ncbi:MAG: dinitrogenase iron-molybdenum cofactor biosynthesis protein [Deltaproteobacteria bacterium]|jgi:predicted Fe-Mo cluster-binding NifX family protein|nr:dinitrogenase iron-molybdenum cofactor biosynthesis protein [Deltaproteobacteria bacterium]
MAETLTKDRPGAARPRPRVNRGAYRPSKVAVASDSGVNIDACFGKVENFRIYRLQEDQEGCRYEFEEFRAGPKPCQEKSHDEGVLEASAELLKDCGMVLAGRIGPGAVKALSDRGIMGLAAPLGLEEALKRLARG